MTHQYINNKCTARQYQHNVMVTPVLHVVSSTTMSEGMSNSEVNQNDVANKAESGYHKVRLIHLNQYEYILRLLTNKSFLHSIGKNSYWLTHSHIYQKDQEYEERTKETDIG